MDNLFYVGGQFNFESVEISHAFAKELIQRKFAKATAATEDEDTEEDTGSSSGSLALTAHSSMVLVSILCIIAFKL